MKLALVILALGLAACSSEDVEKPADEPREKHFNPWETQVESLDKARNLEQQMLQDARDRDELMREQGG